MNSNSRADELGKRLEGVLERKIFGPLTKLVVDAGIEVYSVYRWAMKRNFSAIFDAVEYENDRIYASHKVTEMLESMTLEEIVDHLIESQAEVVWHRRVCEGKNGGVTDKDRQEAKRYISFLIFNDLLKLCADGKYCPRDVLINSEWGNYIVFLLKSLSLEDYCKIHAYLSYKNREQSGKEDQNLAQRDFLGAMGIIDRSFYCCGRNDNHDVTMFAGHFLTEHDNIARAKLNRSDTLGTISERTVDRFMEVYYGFLDRFIKGHNFIDHAPSALIELYRSGNTRIVNAGEFLLKCCISAHVPDDIHMSIRQDCYKNPSLG